jgi:tRNA nucleotidyltransferase/poly(A) polymerase
MLPPPTPTGFLSSTMTNQPITTPAIWLADAGFSAYLVGNQVRDRLLEITTDRSDVDIATVARPSEVVSILRHNNIIPSIVDEKFGVVSFGFEGIHFEVTTLRQDIYNGDFTLIKRYPDEIRFVKLLAQDALRRDFTINAIYFNPKTKRYMDYVGGMADMKAKIIRSVGDPAVRFLEDPIRILRAIRLRHVLGFEYDQETGNQIKLLAHHIKKISPGVVKKELQKLQAIANYPSAREELRSLGIIQIG